MILCSILVVLLLFFLLLVIVYNFVDGQCVVFVGVVDWGEFILDKDKFSYKNWNSVQLVGKVCVVQYIVGCLLVKEKNVNLIEVIKVVGFLYDCYQIIIIVNIDDVILGIGMFVCNSIESNKKFFLWL